MLFAHGQHATGSAWFLLTVSVQSVAVLAGLLLKENPGDLLAFVAVGAFGLGLVLYIVVMTLIFARWTLSPLDPGEIHPPAWIAGGAVAITTLAGSNLLAAAPGTELIERVSPYLEGATLLAWSTATFWFPIMVAVGVWRHVVRRVPLVYDPSLWAMVFPLGMYAAATFAMLKAVELPELDLLPRVALAIAGVAWLVTAAGLARRLAARRG